MKKVLIILGFVFSLAFLLGSEKIERIGEVIINNSDTLILRYNSGTWSIYSDTTFIIKVDTIYIGGTAFSVSDVATNDTLSDYLKYNNIDTFRLDSFYLINTGLWYSSIETGNVISAVEQNLNTFINNAVVYENGDSATTDIDFRWVNDTLVLFDGGLRISEYDGGPDILFRYNTSVTFNNIATDDDDFSISNTLSGIGKNNDFVVNAGNYVRIFSNKFFMNNISNDSIARFSDGDIKLFRFVNITDSLLVNEYVRADSFVSLTQTYADYVFEKNYKITSLGQDIRYAKEQKTLPKLKNKNGNISRRLENIIETVERLYLQVYNNFRIIYIILFLIIIWNIVITYKLIKRK